MSRTLKAPSMDTPDFASSPKNVDTLFRSPAWNVLCTSTTLCSQDSAGTSTHTGEKGIRPHWLHFPSLPALFRHRDFCYNVSHDCVQKLFTFYCTQQN